MEKLLLQLWFLIYFILITKMHHLSMEGLAVFGNLGGHFGDKTQPLILETDESIQYI